MLASYLDILSDRERQRYRRLQLEPDRRQYLVAHVLLRTALSRAAGGEVDPRRWRFTENDRGKPAVTPAEGLPCLHFSLSHCSGLAVVAVSSTCAVGVDIEPLKRTGTPTPLDTILGPGERAWLQSRPPPVRWTDFTRLWTVKEAYAKLVGHGLSLDFTSFEVALDPVRMVRTETGGPQPDDLRLETREIHMGRRRYHLSLAARRPPVGVLAVTLRVLDSPLVELQHEQSTGGGRQ